MRSGGASHVAALLLALSCATFTASCAPRSQHLVERSLQSTGGLDCWGYLAWNQEPVRDVFLVINGSGTLSNAFLVPTFEELVRFHPVAYATYDKPGIRATFGEQKAARRDDATLERYTVGHGEACATEALRWAGRQFGSSARLHLRGHSEGALVALSAYAALLDDDPALAARVATLVLSGVPLEPIDAIIERQLAEAPGGERLRQALAACDWGRLEDSLGVSCTYMEDAARRASGRAVFERLATRAPGARFHVFTGTDDWNTPPGPVRALEAWNASTGNLRIDFHFYSGGHTGGEAAKAELRRVLTEIVNEGTPR